MPHDVKNKPNYVDLAISGQRLLIGPASPMKRLFAFGFDLIIINFILLIPFQRLITYLVPAKNIWEIQATEMMMPLMIVSIAIGLVMLLYFSIFEFIIAQTPGKMLFGLYVVSTNVKEKKLEKINFTQTILRNLEIIPVFPFFILLLVDPIFIFFNENNQRLLEIISKTIVIERYTYDPTYN